MPVLSLLIAFLIAALFGFLAYWVAGALRAPHPIPPIVGVLVFLAVFLAQPV